MANFCSKCGEPLSPDAKFCSACGAQVSSPVNLSKTTETPANDERDNSSLSGGRVPDKGFYENFLRRDGRLNRWRYLKRITLLIIIETIITAVIFAANSNLIGELTPTGNLATKFVLAVIQIPFYCLLVRRLQDCGRSEKLAYAMLVLNALTIIMTDYRTFAEPSALETVITLLSAAIGLYAMFCPGTKGTNQYGADPLA